MAAALAGRASRRRQTEWLSSSRTTEGCQEVHRSPAVVADLKFRPKSVG